MRCKEHLLEHRGLFRFFCGLSSYFELGDALFKWADCSQHLCFKFILFDSGLAVICVALLAVICEALEEHEGVADDGIEVVFSGVMALAESHVILRRRWDRGPDLHLRVGKTYAEAAVKSKTNRTAIVA